MRLYAALLAKKPLLADALWRAQAENPLLADALPRQGHVYLRVGVGVQGCRSFEMGGGWVLVGRAPSMARTRTAISYRSARARAPRPQFAINHKVNVVNLAVRGAGGSYENRLVKCGFAFAGRRGQCARGGEPRSVCVCGGGGEGRLRRAEASAESLGRGLPAGVGQGGTGGSGRGRLCSPCLVARV